MKVTPHVSPDLLGVIQSIIRAGGRAFLVGGAVRDTVLNIPFYDADIEVHGLSEEKLETVLKQHGTVSYVGKAFGVFRIHTIDADWSLPRTDSSGRKPIVMVDPGMSIEKALRRRDITMNAMAIDLQTHELIDPFGGIEDMRNKKLRAVDPVLFEEDPLRFFRVMQLMSRFEMDPDEELNDLCSRIMLTTVSRERIEEEFRKLLLLSCNPSKGIRWLASINRLRDLLPELYATIDVPQNPQWHPEGDVFEHSMQALDAAALIAQKYDTEFYKLVLLYAALCHDLGKVSTTKTMNGIIKSIGHEVKSKEYARMMLRRITHHKELIQAVECLVFFHMMPLQFIKNKAKLSAYKRLAAKLLSSVSLSFLADLCLADKQGRNGEAQRPLSGSNNDVESFIAQAEAAGVLYAPEDAIITGADLKGYCNPGPRYGRLLAQAYEIQINEGITEKAILLKRILKN